LPGGQVGRGEDPLFLHLETENSALATAIGHHETENAALEIAIRRHETENSARSSAILVGVSVVAGRPTPADAPDAATSRSTADAALYGPTPPHGRRCAAFPPRPCHNPPPASGLLCSGMQGGGRWRATPLERRTVMAETQRGRRFDVVLAGTRFTPACDAALDAAFALARRFGSRVILIHVVDRRSHAAQARRRLDASAARAPDLPVETMVAFGEPGHAIARAAQHAHADVIVVGRGRPSDALVPLAIDEVLARAAPCPVVSFAPGEDVDAAVRHLRAAEVQPRRCLLCTQPSADVMCETCRTRVTAEAFEHKRRVEKAGSGH
jgi:nucleotide-binding universal stress UspA family protein